jgi:hypothetical protein
MRTQKYAVLLTAGDLTEMGDYCKNFCMTCMPSLCVTGFRELGVLSCILEH